MTEKLALIRPMTEEEQQALMKQMMAQQQAATAAATATPDTPPAPTPEAVEAGFDAADPSTWGNPGRNDTCPCGSGKKFKHCHGAL